MLRKLVADVAVFGAQYLPAHYCGRGPTLGGISVAPVVTLVPPGTPRFGLTPAGRRLVICSAIATPSTTCLTCQLCANIDRQEIVGVLPHGRQKRAAAIIASGVVHRHLGRAPAFA